MKIDLTFPEHPGKTYQGTLVAHRRRHRSRQPHAAGRNRRRQPRRRAAARLAGPGSLQNARRRVQLSSCLSLRSSSAREGLQSAPWSTATMAHLVPVVDRRGRRRHCADRHRPQRQRPGHSGSARLAHRRRKESARRESTSGQASERGQVAMHRSRNKTGRFTCFRCRR